MDNFMDHMRTTHPGCGNKNNHYAYQSGSGLYFRALYTQGRCGSLNTNYYLCLTCHSKFINQKEQTQVTIPEK